MTLGLPARAQRALDALHLNYWLIHTAEYVPALRKVRVCYERPTGEVVRFEFEFPEGEDTEEWIESELISRLRSV